MSGERVARIRQKGMQIMKKIDYAVAIVAWLYKAPIDMIPETHKEVRAYMRLTKDELRIKFCSLTTLNATKLEVTK